MATYIPLTIYKGETFNPVFRWMSKNVVFKNITNISNDGPCRIDVVAHGLPEGWPVWITGAKGLTKLNATDDPDELPAVGTKFYRTSVVDANAIVLPEIDSSLYPLYTGGGHVRYYAPMPLTGWEARSTFRTKITSTDALWSFVSPASILIDPVLFTVALLKTATDTAAITWKKAVYDVEMVHTSTGTVKRIIEGPVVVSNESTR